MEAVARAVKVRQARPEGRRRSRDLGPLFDPSAQLGAFGVGHAGFVAERHAARSYRAFVNFRRIFLNIAGRIERVPVQLRPDAIAHRLNLYEEQTAPLIEYYASDSRLVVVDGVASPESVFARITIAVDAARRAG